MTWSHREQPAFPSPIPGAPPLPVDLSSFSELLRRQAPELLPVNRQAAAPSDALPHFRGRNPNDGSRLRIEIVTSAKDVDRDIRFLDRRTSPRQSLLYYVAEKGLPPAAAGKG